MMSLMAAVYRLKFQSQRHIESAPISRQDPGPGVHIDTPGEISRISQVIYAGRNMIVRKKGPIRRPIPYMIGWHRAGGSRAVESRIVGIAESLADIAVLHGRAQCT